MSNINVTVTNAGAASVAVSGGSTVNATVGNGGAVNVSLGTISPGDATVVSGTLAINSVTTLAAGSQAYVKNDLGTAFAAQLDIGIPAGPATIVTVAKTTTLAAGSSATVTGVADGASLALSFGIPAGADGTNGTNGVTPTITTSATTLSAGSEATVTATPSDGGSAVALAFGIPRGADGAAGAGGGATLSDSTPAALGTASAGVSTTASRSDHVHALPIIAYANLSGVPANFPTNATLVSGLAAGYAVVNHAHSYVTSLNNLTGDLTLAAGSNVSLSVANSTLTISSVGGGITANDSIDGGNYIGEILGGITFATQPQSQTLTAATTLSFSNQITPTVPNSGTLHSVASLGNQLLAIASSSVEGSARYYGFLHIVTSSNNGSSFSQELTVASSENSSEPVVISPTTNLIFTSNGSRTVFTDGYSGLRYFDGGGSVANSTGPIAPLGEASYGVAYLASAGRFVSIADTKIASSSDGVSWTPRLSTSQIAASQYGGQETTGLNRFVFALGSRFVVLTATGLSRSGIYHSTDGVTWTTIDRSYGYSSAASNGSRVVAARGGASSVDYSTDGLTWTTVSLPVPVSQVSHAAGLFWAFPASPGSLSTDVLTSPDGVTWTLRDLPSGQTIFGAAMAGSNVAFLLASSNKAFQATLSTAAASANLTVSAATSSGNPVSYQWQSSLDAGTTWSNVANATTSTLSLTGLTPANTGTRYRAAASATGAATAFSSSAILTVSG